MAEYERRGGIVGLCFGSFSEGGPGMHALLAQVAAELSQRWRQLGGNSEGDVKSYVTRRLYLEWGAAFGRVNARLRLTRLEAVGGRGHTAGEPVDLGSAGALAAGARPDVGGRGGNYNPRRD